MPSLPWVMGAFVICCVVCCPLFLIVNEIIEPPTEGWQQLSMKDPGGLLKQLGLESEIPEHSRLYYRIRTTLLLLVTVAGLSLVTGVTLAWLTSRWRFPLQRIMSFLLILPLTVPSYILATSYKLLTIDLKNSWSVSYREKFGAASMMEFDEYWNFALASMVLTAAFFPYVYIAARSAFTTLSVSYQESAQCMGCSSSQVFRRVALPLARPAIVGGVMLVCLETLNEFGAMKILGIDTLTTEIFYVWVNLEDKSAAIRLSGCIMLILLVLLVLEQCLRGGKRFHANRNTDAQQPDQTLGKLPAFGITLFCLVVFVFSFILPVYQLVNLAVEAIPDTPITHFTHEIVSSIWLAAKAAVAVLAVSLFLAYANRIVPHWSMVLLGKISTLGYAIPGAILGVTIIAVVAFLKTSMETTGFIDFVFYGSTYGLVIAYVIRFLAIGLPPLEAGLKQIHPHLDEASQLLQRNSIYSFVVIHLPMLKHAVLAGMLMLFIDIFKELPLTLILNPSNHETLATRSYSLFAVEERYATGSIPALILIVTGIIGLLVIQGMFSKAKR